VPLQLPHPGDARAKPVMEALVANPGDMQLLGLQLRIIV
jgi:hypothetical protein